MKSEERHRLQENELERFGRHARAWIEKYGLMTAVAIVGVAVIVGGIVLWVRGHRESQAQRWDRMITANDPSIFGEIADEHPESTVGRWARLMEAQQALAEGIQLSLTDREGAVVELLAARKAFNEVLNAGDASALIRERALFGQAQTLETLAGVQVDKKDKPVQGVEPAIKAYQELVQDFPNSVYVPDAKARIAALKSDEVQEFYAWFREQNPSPADRVGPQDRTSPGAGAPFDPFQPGAPGMSPGTSGDNGLQDLDRFLDKHGIDTGDMDTAKPAQAEKPARGPELTPPGGTNAPEPPAAAETPAAPATNSEPVPAATNP
jgi:hypothetical protein